MNKVRSAKLNWRPRFGIGGLLLLTFVFCVMGAAARQFVLAVREGSSPRVIFVIFTLAAPMVMVAALGIGHQLWSWWRNMRK